MRYAIIEIGGRQIWVEPGKFYDVNHIKGEPGDIVNLQRVLLVHQEEVTIIGKPCITSINIRATILKHFKDKKVIVFKMKSKKNTRVKHGHRQQLTRLFIEEIEYKTPSIH